MPTLINLTPHAMHVYARDTPDQIDPAEHQPLRVYAPSGTLARGGIRDADGWDLGPEKVVDIVHYGAVGLPPYAGQMDDQARELWYLVSLVTALSAVVARRDLLVPHLAVRDLNGRTIGCRSFARPI